MRILFLQLFLLFFCIAESQQLYFNHLSVNNGLSQGVNNCIVKDSKGYIWISSFDGLNRFDGTECKKYYAAQGQPNGIKGTLFLNILEDINGDMWIGSNEGLNVYNRSKDSFNCYRLTGTGSGDQFCSPFYVDDKNRIWVQSGAGIFIFDPAQKTFTKIKNIPGPGSSIIVKAAAQKQFLPVQTLVAVSNNPAAFFKANVSGNQINWQMTMLPAIRGKINTLQVKDNDYWFGTAGGLYRCSMYEPGNCKLLGNQLKANISSVYFDNSDAGTIWAGTVSDGLLKIDTAGNLLQQFVSNPDNIYSLSGNQVTYIYTDDDRNLWLSVWGKGVDYTNLNKFHFNQYINKTEALKAGTDNFIRSVVAIDHEIWCATQSGGIIVLDADKKIKQVIKKELPSAVEHLCADGNTVWAATFSGLFAINTAGKQVSRINTASSPLQLNAVSQQYNYISELHDGSLLLSSNSGLFRMIRSGSALQITRVKGIDASAVYLTTYENREGILFISKAFGGFGTYTLKNDSLQRLKQFPLQATIKCFTDTYDSVMWIGSTIGLIRFNKVTASITKIYTTHDGLSNQYIYGVIPDGDYLWLSSNAGINRLNVKRNEIKTFTMADGLQGNEYNTYSFCKTAAGEILFGGVNGLNGFSPGTIEPFRISPSLVLSNILVEDSLYHIATNHSELKKLVVAYGQNTIGFQFTVIDFVNAAAARISYMLEGYDKTWVNAANKSVLRYVNLPPGDYVLKVKAFNADGIMAAQVYALPVSVMPPWWQTWWFRLLAVTVIVSGTVLLIRNYLHRRLLKQKLQLEKELAVEQERIRMARELHDGLGSMLSGIKHSFSAIKNEAHLDNDEKKKFQYTIDKLDDSIKDLRAISHTMFSAQLLEEGLDAAIKNYCNSVSITSRLPVAFESIYQQPAGLKGEQAFHIFRVVQELVQNIIRHADATEALVQLSYHNNMLSVTVEDNGNGFDIQKLKHHEGIGLKNVEDRVKMLHGKVDIQSHSGKGTSVFIEVPV